MTGVPSRRADLATATVVSPSPRRTALRLVLSTLAGVGGGLAVGAPLGRWATVAGRGPGFLPGLYELVLAVVVSVIVGVAVAVLALRATSRTDPERRPLVLAYGLTFLGLLLSAAVAAAPFLVPLLVVVPLVVVRRLRARWLVVTLGLTGASVGVVAAVFFVDQHRQDAEALESYAGPLLTFTPPAPYVLDAVSLPSPFDDDPDVTYRFTAGASADAIYVELSSDAEVVLCQQVDRDYPPCRQVPVATGSLYEGSSTYYWLREDGVVQVDAGRVDEATVLALLASAEPITREELADLDR